MSLNEIIISSAVVFDDTSSKIIVVSVELMQSSWAAARAAPFVAVKRVRRKLKLNSWNSFSIVAALVVPRARKTLLRVLDRILK